MSEVVSTKKRKKRNAKFDKLIGPTDAKIDAQARERIITARISLLLNHAFFGNLATRLKLVNADDWCPTAATDGLRMYYNSRFIMMLKPKEVIFLVAHEVLHVVYDHLGRLGNRDPEFFNIANDYAVNADLKRHKIGEFIKTVPALYEPKYENMASEEIYDDLMKNVKKINLDDLINQMIDEHLEGDDQNEGDGEGQSEEEKERNAKRPKSSDEERDRMRQEMKQAIIAAAQGVEAGSLPAGVARMIKEMTTSVMPWRDIIQTSITSCVKVNYSWQRPSRKGWDSDAVMPGMIPGEEIDVAVFIDLSGSISRAQAKDFISEVAGMINAFDGFKLYLACFDTEVYNPQTFSSENMDTVDEYELTGGGGTSFECIFSHLKEQEIVPAKLIVFTDGCPNGSWGQENYADTVWVIHGSNDITPPWGSWSYYDDHKKS